MEQKPVFLPYIGIDIGGTLTKICFTVKKGTKVNFETLDAYTMSYYKEFDIYFVQFNSSDIDRLCNFISDNQLNKIIEKFYITGGGVQKYEEILVNKLNIKIHKIQEFESLSLRFQSLLRFSYDDSIFQYSFEQKKQFIVLNNEIFPLLLVNIGSGVSMIRFDSASDFKRITGTPLGGGFFLGLSHLILGNNNFDDIMQMIKQGNNQNVDINKNNQSIDHQLQENLNKEFSPKLVSLGQVMHQKSLNQSIQKEDVLKSLLIATLKNICQIAFLVSMNQKIYKVFFCGNFINNREETMGHITQTMQNYMQNFTQNQSGDLKNQKIQVYFIKPDGFVGALGCLFVQLKESIKV